MVSPHSHILCPSGAMQGKFCHTKFFQERKRADTGTGATQNPCTCIYDVSLISDLSREYAKRDHRFASLVARYDVHRGTHH